MKQSSYDILITAFFKIDELNAYFYAERIWRGGIEIPSNMNFEMTDNTHLRAHLNTYFRAVIFIGDKENIKVSGGNLHGNRNTPGFDISYAAHGSRSLIIVKTGVNITFENREEAVTFVTGVKQELADMQEIDVFDTLSDYAWAALIFT